MLPLWGQSHQRGEQCSVNLHAKGRCVWSWLGAPLVPLLVSLPDSQPPVLQERTVRLKSTFGALTVWNLERAPSADDGLLLALSWPGIAEAVSTGVLLSCLFPPS